MPKATLSRRFVVRKVARALNLGEVELDVKEAELWLEAA